MKRKEKLAKDLGESFPEWSIAIKYAYLAGYDRARNDALCICLELGDVSSTQIRIANEISRMGEDEVCEDSH